MTQHSEERSAASVGASEFRASFRRVRVKGGAERKPFVLSEFQVFYERIGANVRRANARTFAPAHPGTEPAMHAVLPRITGHRFMVLAALGLLLAWKPLGITFQFEAIAPQETVALSPRMPSPETPAQRLVEEARLQKEREAAEAQAQWEEVLRKRKAEQRAEEERKQAAPAPPAAPIAPAAPRDDTGPDRTVPPGAESPSKACGPQSADHACRRRTKPIPKY